MSDIKKWMKLMESVESTIVGQTPNSKGLEENDTVTISPRVGGGVGRFVGYTPSGAVVDIKGVMRELSIDDFSAPIRNLDTGNDWSHVSQEDTTIGTINDKPEFRPGDIVKVEDVYGAVIGPGFGIFIAYSTDGRDGIISFDGKEILVPTANISSVVEQNAKDNFNEVDNDGNLSPMSLGSQNIKIQEPSMDHRDEFSKWMASVEEALASDSTPIDEELLEQGACGGCGAWDCPECFPDTTGELSGIEGQQIPATIIIGKQPDQEQQMPPAQGIGMAGTHPVDGDTFDHSEEDDIDIALMGDKAFAEGDEESAAAPDTTPRSGKGIKLGHIVNKFVKAGDTSMPSEQDTNESRRDPDTTYNEWDDEPNTDDPLAQQEFNNEMSQIDPDEALEIIGKIKYMQDLGFSKSNKTYSEEQLAQLPAVKLKQVQQEVMGAVVETDGPKPTKTKTKSAFDEFDPLDFSKTEPLAKYNDSNGSDKNSAPVPSMPSASAASTRAKTSAMNPSELMRSMMNRINPTAGGDEPELAQPQDQENALVARSASDVPAVISNAMQTTGFVAPEWHTVNNLPGYQQQNVRGMGRQIFSMFTSTPLEQIQTMANVDGQGPNTPEEMRAVANWLMQNAEDLGKIELSHGRAIPGYKPDVKEYSLNGVRFHVVRDQMGQYIYAYPDADATTKNGASQLINQPGNMPKLREEENMTVKLTITEAIKFDDIIRDGLKSISENVELEESSLSKLIGKQKGGQKLVQWLHRKHKLGNEAELQPQPFSERMLWKEFKSNPDNFVIVSATGGVAGIKPYEQMIKDRTAAAAKKGKVYNPGGDSTLQYQIIAFTDDGKQVDPALLQPKPEAGEEREEDPTVMRARMGKISGKDTQNPDNVFNLLADQIGALRTVYLAPHGVERGKMAKRADMNKPAADMSDSDAINTIFKKIRPVLKKLASQAESTIKKRIQRYNDGGNYEGAQKLAGSAIKLKQFLATIDTSGDVNTMGGDLNRQLRKALADASGASQYSTAYTKYLTAAARGNAAALKPVLDAMRDNLVGLQ